MTLTADPAGVRPTGRLRRWAIGVKRVPLIVWVFLAVPLAMEAYWVFWPALNSFSLSLTSWRGVGAAEPVGLANYRRLLADPIFHIALRNNVIWVVLFGSASVALGLCFAVALNRPRRGVGLYRIALYLPMVVSLTVSGMFWRVMYAPSGPINATLELLGLGSLTQQWLADPEIALYAVLVAAVWRQVGYIMVLYLAGLKGVDQSLEEAAAVDGANAWQRFWRIVMPQLRNVTMVVFAVTVIDSLRTFDIVWAMTRGGPYNQTQLLSTYMFQQGFTNVNLGYGSAIAVVIFALAILFIITYLISQLSREDD